MRDVLEIRQITFGALAVRTSIARFQQVLRLCDASATSYSSILGRIQPNQGQEQVTSVLPPLLSPFVLRAQEIQRTLAQGPKVDPLIINAGQIESVMPFWTGRGEAMRGGEELAPVLIIWPVHHGEELDRNVLMRPV